MSDEPTASEPNGDAARPAFVQRSEALLGRVAEHSTKTTRKRFRNLLRVVLPILQSAVAATVAYFIANDLLGHPSPFFAPIAAVLSLGVSLGQRLRRSFEIALGVAVGVLAGELLAALIGRGSLELGLFVTIAMAFAVLLGGGPMVVNQSAGTAILIATLAIPGSADQFGFTRFLDALIGGGVGFVVNAALLPINPVGVARRAADRVLDELIGTLGDLATALEERDREKASTALGRALETENRMREFEEDLTAGQEITRISPARWRLSGHVTRYGDAMPEIGNAVRNVRVLARRSAALLRVGESMDPQVIAAVRRLQEAVRTLRNELAKGVEPRAARLGLVDTARLLAGQSASELDFSASVVVAQLRSTAYDLLLATGLSRSRTDTVLDDLDRRARREHRDQDQHRATDAERQARNRDQNRTRHRDSGTGQPDQDQRRQAGDR